MAYATEGHFVWYEHLTRDVEAAKAFYGRGPEQEVPRGREGDREGGRHGRRAS